jgi:hypothetical protein
VSQDYIFLLEDVIKPPLGTCSAVTVTDLGGGGGGWNVVMFGFYTIRNLPRTLPGHWRLQHPTTEHS